MAPPPVSLIERFCIFMSVTHDRNKNGLPRLAQEASNYKMKLSSLEATHGHKFQAPPHHCGQHLLVCYRKPEPRHARMNAYVKLVTLSLSAVQMECKPGTCLGF